MATTTLQQRASPIESRNWRNGTATPTAFSRTNNSNRTTNDAQRFHDSDEEGQIDEPSMRDGTSSYYHCESIHSKEERMSSGSSSSFSKHQPSLGGGSGQRHKSEPWSSSSSTTTTSSSSRTNPTNNRIGNAADRKEDLRNHKYPATSIQTSNSFPTHSPHLPSSPPNSSGVSDGSKLQKERQPSQTFPKNSGRIPYSQAPPSRYSSNSNIINGNPNHRAPMCNTGPTSHPKRMGPPASSWKQPNRRFQNNNHNNWKAGGPPRGMAGKNYRNSNGNRDYNNNRYNNHYDDRQRGDGRMMAMRDGGGADRGHFVNPPYRRDQPQLSRNYNNPKNRQGSYYGDMARGPNEGPTSTGNGPFLHHRNSGGEDMLRNSFQRPSEPTRPHFRRGEDAGRPNGANRNPFTASTSSGGGPSPSQQNYATEDQERKNDHQAYTFSSQVDGNNHRYYSDVDGDGDIRMDGSHDESWNAHSASCWRDTASIKGDGRTPDGVVTNSTDEFINERNQEEGLGFTKPWTIVEATESPGKRDLPVGECRLSSPPKKRWRETEPEQTSQAPSIPGSRSVEAGSVAALENESNSTHTKVVTKQSPTKMNMETNAQSLNSTLKGNTEDSKKSNSFVAKNEDAMKKPSANGIPLRWLKPGAKPKKPTPKTATVSAVKTIPSIATNGAMGISKEESKSVARPKESPRPPPSPASRLVTDASEGGSTVSNKDTTRPSASLSRPKLLEKIPEAIVTSNPPNASTEISVESREVRAYHDVYPSKNTDGVSLPLQTKPKDDAKVEDLSSMASPLEESHPRNNDDDEWDSDATSKPGSESDSDCDTDIDEEEVERWAARLLGKHVLDNKSKPERKPSPPRKLPKLKIRLSPEKMKQLSNSRLPESNDPPEVKQFSSSDSKENGNAYGGSFDTKKLLRKKEKEMKRKKASKARSIKRAEYDEEKVMKEMEEERRKREEAKPLTAEEIKAILGDDDFAATNQNNWVRRSVRQPSKALLNTKPVRMLLDKLRLNDPDVVVLKMKKYINDPAAPCAVLDEALNALEENSNCEALYIQNFNQGMKDQQVLHLLRILQQPKCKIWCLNIGENYNVGDETWEKFTKGLVHTKITHMYASEHTITGDMKDEIRETIRENRKKHNMHCDPDNLDVIVQCTHNWWNPINAKVLRPYLKKKGYEHMLNDKEAQGLRGSTSAAPTK